MSDIQKIIVPDVGGDEVEVIELCVAVGDNIEADEGVVTVESDKASMDIPAPFEGEIVSLTVSVGDKIKEGDVIVAEAEEVVAKAIMPDARGELHAEKVAVEANRLLHIIGDEGHVVDTRDLHHVSPSVGWRSPTTITDTQQ